MQVHCSAWVDNKLDQQKWCTSAAMRQDTWGRVGAKRRDTDERWGCETDLGMAAGLSQAQQRPEQLLLLSNCQAPRLRQALRSLL